MDKDLLNRAKEAAEMLNRNPALLDYVERYYEKVFLDYCLSSASDAKEGREQAYRRLEGVKDAVAALKLLR